MSKYPEKLRKENAKEIADLSQSNRRCQDGLWDRAIDCYTLYENLVDSETFTKHAEKCDRKVNIKFIAEEIHHELLSDYDRATYNVGSIVSDINAVDMMSFVDGLKAIPISTVRKVAMKNENTVSHRQKVAWLARLAEGKMTSAEFNQKMRESDTKKHNGIDYKAIPGLKTAVNEYNEEFITDMLRMLIKTILIIREEDRQVRMTLRIKGTNKDVIDPIDVPE